MVDFTTIPLLILLIIGLVLTFYGRRVLKTVAFLIGAIIGASIGLLLGLELGDLTPLGPSTCGIIALIVGAIIGGYLGMAFLKWMIAMYMGVVGYTIAFAIYPDFIIALIIGIIVFVIILILFDKFLSVITALFGAFLVGMAVMLLATPFIGDFAFVLFIVVAVVLAVVGARAQSEQT